MDKKQTTDYYDEGGLLCCGICRERKETLFPEDVQILLGRRTHPIPCACRRAEMEEAARQKEAELHRQTVDLLRERCFPDRKMQKCTFSNAGKDIPALELCRRYAERFEAAEMDSIGLLLWGGVGSGKSYLAACIANELIDREVSVRMLNFGQILNAGFDERDRIVQTLGRCSLLILDDFGMERQTEYGMEMVFHVIDARYRSGKPLIVTTNLSLRTLEHPDDLGSQRIYDRILEMCVPVKVDGESFRTQERQRKKAVFRSMTAETKSAGRKASGKGWD